MVKNAARRCALGLALAAGALALVGCGWNRINTTQITVQFSGERLLTLAFVPRVLPDGKPATQKINALKKDLAEVSQGYACIEQVASSWGPPGKGKDTEEEKVDLLFVLGRPELAYMLRARLREEFGLKQPFVITLPTQSIVTLRAVETGRPRPGQQAPEKK